ncbi:transcriptional regulator [Asanoa ishikariensis]|uniref:Transcriptional regulator, ArsR family n=1 Tax=Asanoa ishikariensis TaxID=137265 RepID=A0A1H3R818_9ACTN|nr:metalloregulator ArsR/SmtB family transcription factor [Asanoa ishikariensis]GIF64352.1 transcriptional regulator [Asanoa ishikariensis]SDZ21401.1 transcriptional regulator, ArsR family [Asanoa ishikariensis]
MAERHVRQVTDSRVLAAMSHPLRRRLLDVLTVYGPQPVGALAERTGQAPANISHHMKVMRECDLVEEAPELARDRRERWWRPVSAGLRWSGRDFDDDPGEAAVLRAAESLNLDHQVGLVREWYAAPDEEQAVWGESTFAADRWLHLTPAELLELSRDLVALLDRWSARSAEAAAEPGDETRRPVFVFAHGIPATP